MKNLIIFDLDGTLVDTIADLAAACNFALGTCGFPTHHLSTYKFYVGNGVGKLIERALPNEEANPENISKTWQAFMEYYDTHNTDNSKPYDGIQQLLRVLTDMGMKLAVASNKYQAAVERIIYTLFPDIPWVAVEGQKPNINIKPDPSVIFEILTKSPAPKSEVIMVGDSGVDMDTAHRAAIESVGVSWGFRPESELIEHYADHIIHKPEELLNLI